jgi:hypothetical protein
MRAEFHADPLKQRLAQAIETECFRVAQGALTHVVRHAKAKTVSVELPSACFPALVRAIGPYNNPAKAKVTLAFVGLLYQPKPCWAGGWTGW